MEADMSGFVLYRTNIATWVKYPLPATPGSGENPIFDPARAA